MENKRQYVSIMGTGFNCKFIYWERSIDGIEDVIVLEELKPERSFM
jgi:hypothetical protein